MIWHVKSWEDTPTSFDGNGATYQRDILFQTDKGTQVQAETESRINASAIRMRIQNQVLLALFKKEKFDKIFIRNSPLQTSSEVKSPIGIQSYVQEQWNELSTSGIQNLRQLLDSTQRSWLLHQQSVTTTGSTSADSLLEGNKIHGLTCCCYFPEDWLQSVGHCVVSLRVGG
jgi:hypothetical protein